MKRKTLLAFASATVMTVATSYAASTLTGGLSPVKLDADAEDSFDAGGEARISVFDNTLRYSSDPNDTTASETGDPTISPLVDVTVAGPVQDYRFFGSSFSTVANGSPDLISDLTVGTSSGKPYTVGVWTDTDPGASFGSTKDVTAGGTRGGFSGTVDISGLSSGSVYFIFGNNGSSSPRGIGSITMSGTSADLTLADIKVASSGNGIAATFIASIDFTNEGDYDTISYASTDGFVYFSGVVVTGVPEPSAALLGALGMLCLLRRRR